MATISKVQPSDSFSMNLRKPNVEICEDTLPSVLGDIFVEFYLKTLSLL